MKHIFNNTLSDLKEGKIIYGFYYCNDKIVKYSKSGDIYLDILLTDASTSMYGKVWSHADYFNSKFCSNDSVAIKGKIIRYRDRLELNILNINVATIELYQKYDFKV